MSEDVMLQEAIEAIREGQRGRARDLLTRLLRADQANPVYWLWMSSVVGSLKEQVFCLQSVLRLDPDNLAARQGMVLLGAMPPDEKVVPVPPVRRKWEVEVGEEPPPEGLRAFWANPIFRVLAFGGIGVVVIGLILAGIFGFGRRPAPVALRPTKTLSPITTFTATPTYIGQPVAEERTATPTPRGPQPLWLSLKATYTATPPYVNTPHAISEAFRAGQRAFRRGDWASAADFFLQAVKVNPEAPDVQFYLGEALRLGGEYDQAIQAYDQSLAIDSGFAPAYLGRARARLALNPQADVADDLQQAIEADPSYAEAYLEQAAYFLGKDDLEAAQEDLQAAEKLSPDSPLLYLYRAQVELKSEQDAAALESAQKALELDRTSLPAYRTLGEAALLNEKFNLAIDTLKTYLTYQEDDPSSWLALGRAYAGLGEPTQVYTDFLQTDFSEPLAGRDYSAALEALDKAFELDDQLPGIHLYRGLAYLALGEGQDAVNDLSAVSRREATPAESFALDLGLGRALLNADRLQEGYTQINSGKSLAKTNEQMAVLYFWRAQAEEALDDAGAASADWQALLELPETAFSPSWAQMAEAHIAALATPTITPTFTATSTPTVTPTRKPATQTPSLTPTPRSSATSAPQRTSTP